jgi:hypothetical protein
LRRCSASSTRRQCSHRPARRYRQAHSPPESPIVRGHRIVPRSRNPESLRPSQPPSRSVAHVVRAVPGPRRGARVRCPGPSATRPDRYEMLSDASASGRRTHHAKKARSRVPSRAVECPASNQPRALWSSAVRGQMLYLPLDSRIPPSRMLGGPRVAQRQPEPLTR